MLIISPAQFTRQPASGPSAKLEWVVSQDGRSVGEHGECAASLLPRDGDTVLVLPPSAVSWHRITLPKAPANKLKPALEGLLEDHLLTDTTNLHFAVAPGAKAGQTTWIASCDKSWLRGWLDALDEAGRPVSRIVPGLMPIDPASGALDADPGLTSVSHIHWAHSTHSGTFLSSASQDGVTSVRLPRPDQAGINSPALQWIELHTGSAPGAPSPEDVQTRWLADPTSIATAEALFHRSWILCTQADWLLRCARSAWNLAQFEFSLSSRARMGQRWREAWREWLRAPEWRPARWGVTVLVLSMLAGLNLTAWQERRELEQKRQQAMSLYRQAFPNTPLVADPVDQMQRDIRMARATKGQVGPGDLEAQLAAAAQAMPVDMESPMHLIFGDGQTRLSGWTASREEVDAMQQSLKQRGWTAAQDGDDLIIAPGRD